MCTAREIWRFLEILNVQQFDYRDQPCGGETGDQSIRIKSSLIII